MEGTCSVPACIFNYIVCILIAVGYVGSLYIWRQEKNEDSSSPAVMKKRFISVIGVTIVSPGLVNQFVDGHLLTDHNLWHILGFRTTGLFQACVIPLALTSILFLGPILTNILTNRWSMEEVGVSLKTAGICSIRNYIVAPITEEIVFRACMLALVIHCTSPMSAVVICPMFFGAAHLHKMYEEVKRGVPFKHAFKVSAFQFAYTSLFGAYSAYLFVRTGHVAAPIVAHAFCNFMGFPDFAAVSEIDQPARTFVKFSFLFGVFAWVYLIQQFTDPYIYDNTLPWVQRMIA